MYECPFGCILEGTVQGKSSLRRDADVTLGLTSYTFFSVFVYIFKFLRKIHKWNYWVKGYEYIFKTFDSFYQTAIPKKWYPFTLPSQNAYFPCILVGFFVCVTYPGVPS